jgi:hypothetical protein
MPRDAPVINTRFPRISIIRIVPTPGPPKPPNTAQGNRLQPGAKGAVVVVVVTPAVTPNDIPGAWLGM